MACPLRIFNGKLRKTGGIACEKRDRITMPYIFEGPDMTHKTYRSTTRIDSRDDKTWVERAGQERGTGLYEGSSGHIERNEALSTPRRRLSKIIGKRMLGGELDVGRRSKRTSVDTAPASSSRPVKRRSFAFVAAPLQRFFGAESQPIMARSLSPSNRGPSPEGTYELVQLRTSAEYDWDFVCRGETPVVPARDSSDQLLFLGDFDRVSEDNLISKWSSSSLLACGIGPADPACLTSSPTLPSHPRFVKAANMSSKNISEPIPISSLARRCCAHIPPNDFDVLNSSAVSSPCARDFK